MNLSSTLMLYAGGPGSGCNPAAGTCGRPKGSGGTAFVSPSTDEGLNLEQAISKLNSPEQKSFLQRAQEVASKVSDSSTVHSAVGDWKDGAENSTKIDLEGTDSESVDYAAAKLGMEAHQKGVIAFEHGADGPDSLWVMTAKGSINDVRASLDKHGVDFRTLEPGSGSVTVTVFDQGSKLENNMQGVAHDFQTELSRAQGTGKFIGGDTREEAASAYQPIIGAYEKKRGIKASHQEYYGRGERDHYRWGSQTFEQVIAVADHVEGSFHIDPVPTFHPPSARHPYIVPEYDDPTNDEYLDVTNHRERLVNMMKKLKRSYITTPTPVTTTNIDVM